MGPLEATITASCPLAFSGASGALFAKAVTALVAAHCGIVEDNQWPADEAEDITSNTEAHPTFDFIVVGAGTAGSILASRLCSNFPLNSVLLIEAGDDPGLDSQIPALLFLTQNTDLDWHYETFPDGRSCLGFNNNSCIWSKGRAMGGSSSINAMLYIRGHPNDYNYWEQDGNTGWSYKDLEPYFEKLESKLELQNFTNENPWYDIIKAAWKKLGLHFVNGNNEAQIGTRINTLLTKNGKRLNTAKIYLSDRDNLHVMKNTVVQKIIIHSTTNIASGVKIRHSNGKIMEISANKEIIISAGSVATPQLLMLSGIGPKKHLEESKIECFVDLPVGQNLQDHILVPMFLETNQHTHVTANDLNILLLQYMIDKRGPFSNIGITDFMGFIDTENRGYPNIQFHHTYFTQNDTNMLKQYLKRVGYKDEVIELIENLNKQSDLLGIYPTLLHPKSKGKVLLTNADPKSKPTIKSNYFDNPKDLKSLIEGVKFIQKLTDTESFKALDIKLTMLKIPECLKFSLNSDRYWECYISQMATSIYHPVGTAKMGSKENYGVVNADLLVHGIGNLRVVDASVMPTITSGNTMAPTMVIAEKAADIIKAFYTVKVKEEL